MFVSDAWQECLKWECGYIFFFLHTLLFGNKAKTSKKTFRAVCLLKWVTSKNSVTLKHFQTWRKNGGAVLQVVNNTETTTLYVQIKFKAGCHVALTAPESRL